MLNLTHSTTYEYKIKAWYCSGAAGGTGWSATQTFTSQGLCPDVTYLTVTPNPNNNTRATFCWDTTGAYLYARVKYRVDTTGSSWNNVGGFGVYYPTKCKTKFGIVPGQDYRAVGRAFCDSTMSAFNSNWTPAVFWTQPTTIRVDGSNASLTPIDVYPNPTRDLLHVDIHQIVNNHIELTLINLLGEALPLIFNPQELNHTLDLSHHPKGLIEPIKKGGAFIYKGLPPPTPPTNIF